MSTDRLIEHQHRIAQVRQLIWQAKWYVRLNKDHIAVAQETCAKSRQFLATLRQRLRNQPLPR